jgi:hypothetical protein
MDCVQNDCKCEVEEFERLGSMKFLGSSEMGKEDSMIGDLRRGSFVEGWGNVHARDRVPDTLRDSVRHLL